MKKDANVLIKSIGTLLLMIGILAILYSLYIGSYTRVLWFCYISLLLIGVGLLFGNSVLVASQLNIQLIPLFVWTLDFVTRIFSGKPAFGITEYFFQETSIIPKIITLQHIFTLPLTLIALAYLGLNRKDTWKISILEISVIYILSRLLTPSPENINCVYSPCLPIHIASNYIFFWFGAVILMIFVSNSFIVWFTRKMRSKNL